MDKDFYDDNYEDRNEADKEESKKEGLLNDPEEYTDVEYCTRCKTGMVTERINKNTEKHFFGCSNYPKCRYTRPINMPRPPSLAVDVNALDVLLRIAIALETLVGMKALEKEELYKKTRERLKVDSQKREDAKWEQRGKKFREEHGNTINKLKQQREKEIDEQ